MTPVDPQATAAPPGAAAGSESAPEFIGRYRLLAPLGEGGFGSVYEAEQQYPVKRKVALKLIKAGMDSHEVLARFEAERQTLALMDHPHIASVLDAGTTDAGRPYFVMELVAGKPITDYCDQHRLDLNQRLVLFDQVCAAVQHAHTKGIIHRDLKPGNILVSDQDGQPFAHVIDFGIAKALATGQGDRTRLTEVNQIIGTPLYMSPEQADGNPDIDTRTDVYALGAIFYELLTGTTPIRADSLRAAGYAEMQRLIREVEPPAPSARVAQPEITADAIAECRSAGAAGLRRSLHGELDWIALKALEKERARRYESAAEFAADVRRHLAGEPVQAAPPSRSYRARKFLRRHRLPVLAASLVAASLVVGIVAFAWQAKIARQRADELEQVARFQADMLGSVKPVVAGLRLSDNVRAQYGISLDGKHVSGIERRARLDGFTEQWQQLNAPDAAVGFLDSLVLQPAKKEVTDRFPAQPLVQATLRASLGKVYEDLGRYPEGRALLEQALSQRRQQLGPDALETVQVENQLVTLLIEAGDLPNARRRVDGLLARLKDTEGDFGEERAAALGSLARLLAQRADYRGAIDRATEALALRNRILGPDHKDTLNLKSDLGEFNWEMGKFVTAERIWREVLGRSRKVLGDDDPLTLTSIGNLAVVLEDLGRDDEALSLHREALARDRRLLGNNHPDTLTAVANLAAALGKRGDYAAAEPYYLEAYERRRSVLGPDHPVTLIALNNLAFLRFQQDKYLLAFDLYRTAWQGRSRVLGLDHPDTLGSQYSMGTVLRTLERWNEAISILQDLIDRQERIHGPDSPEALEARDNLGFVYLFSKRPQMAIPFFSQAYERMRGKRGPTDETTIGYGSDLARALVAAGESEKAMVMARALLSAHKRAGTKGWTADEPRWPLANSLLALGRYREAEEELKTLSVALAADRTSPGILQTRVWEVLDKLYASWKGKDVPPDIAARRADVKRHLASKP